MLDKHSEEREKKDYLIASLCVIFAISLAVLMTAIFMPDKLLNKKAEFIPPAFEEKAMIGIPDVSEEHGYTQLYRDGMAYSVYICGVPHVDGINLNVYFTNTEQNDCYLKLRVIDENDNILGETGLLKPGEYVEAVKLKKKLGKGTSVKLKVMSYDTETYESLGAVVLIVTVS